MGLFDFDFEYTSSKRVVQRAYGLCIGLYFSMLTNYDEEPSYTNLC